MVSKYFAIHELVPPHIYDKLGERAWKLLNPELIKSIDKIKEKFPKGKMTINNYFWGRDRKYSGLRTPQSKHYSETSQHSLGNAVDIIFSEYDVEEVRKYLILNHKDFSEIKGIEINTSWLHIDTRNTDDLVLFEA